MSDQPVHPSWERLRPDSQQPWQTLSTRTISEKHHLVSDMVQLHGGSEAEYLYHPCGRRVVFVLPVTASGEAALIRQYRYPLRATITEVVAGGVEEGEDLLSAAQRELKEEVGGLSARWEPLAGFYPQPSFSGAACYPWLALEAQFHEAHHEDSELIERLLLPLDEVYRRLNAGEIANGPSALVLYQARARLQALGLL